MNTTHEPDERPPRPPEASISLDDLTTVWRGLMVCAENWHSHSREFATLIDARRLVEIEMRDQHGDEAWQRVTQRDDGDDTDE